MPVTKNVRCPSCHAVFDWLFLKSDLSDGPDICPRCRYDTRDEKLDSLPTAPHIENIQASRGADYAYRAEEDASKARADRAREEFGLDDAAARAMVTTDWGGSRGNLRPGDVVASQPPANDVSRTMAAAPGTMGHVAPATAAVFAENAHNGVAPYAGMKAKTATRDFHRMTGAPVTDMPALEVVNRDRAIANAPRSRAHFARR